MESQNYINKAKHLLCLLGYNDLLSFSIMYIGGTINVFGHPESSVSFLEIYHKTHDINNEIVQICVNTTYFQPNEKTIALNKYIESLNKNNEYNYRFGISFEQCIKFIENL